MFQKALTTLLIILAGGFGMLAFEVLTNEKIIQLTESKISEDLILTLIANSECSFKTDVDSILLLKGKGVSEKVIQAMIDKARFSSSAAAPSNRSTSEPPSPVLTAPKPAPPPAESFMPTEVGVYYLKEDNNPVEIEPEIVNWRTGGFLKTMATMGLTGGHINGTVRNPVSRYKIKGTEEIYIYAMEGTSASEYQLLRMDEKKERREFRALTGGILHASGGADKNAVYFEPTKIAPRIYKFKLPRLAPGEYGLLAPGAAMSASAASAGKIYTFSVGR